MDWNPISIIQDSKTVDWSLWPPIETPHLRVVRPDSKVFNTRRSVVDVTTITMKWKYIDDGEWKAILQNQHVVISIL
jgi:hypothetical protein